MANLVTTNIRLPAEDLKEYRMYALSQGKSFSGWIREMLDKFISVQVIAGVKEKAEKILKKIKKGEIKLITSNFILDETYTLLRIRMGKAAVLQFHQDLLKS